MQKLIQQIEQWAEDRNLIEGSTPQKQMLKLMEEFGELCGGIAKNKPDVIKDSIGDCSVVLIILKKQLEPYIGKIDLEEINEAFLLEKKYLVELCCLDFGVHYGNLATKLGKLSLGVKYSLSDYDFILCYGSLLAICQTLEVDINDCLKIAYDQIKDRKGKMIDGIWVKEEDL